MLNPQIKIAMSAEIQRIAKIKSASKCATETRDFFKRYGAQMSDDEMIEYLDEISAKGVPEKPIDPVDPEL